MHLTIEVATTAKWTVELDGVVLGSAITTSAPFVSSRFIVADRVGGGITPWGARIDNLRARVK